MAVDTFCSLDFGSGKKYTYHTLISVEILLNTTQKNKKTKQNLHDLFVEIQNFTYSNNFMATILEKHFFKIFFHTYLEVEIAIIKFHIFPYCVGTVFTA